MVVSSVTPADVVQDPRVPAGLLGQALADGGVEHPLLFALRVVQDRRVLLRLAAQMHQQGGVAAVVQDHVGVPPSRPLHDAVGELPVLLQGFALEGEHRDAVGRDGRGGVVLGREDIAGGPAHLGAQRGQGLDQHRGLNRHVQAAGDARALEGLLAGILGPHRHQARHLGLGDGDLFATPVRQGQIGHLDSRCLSPITTAFIFSVSGK